MAPSTKDSTPIPTSQLITNSLVAKTSAELLPSERKTILSSKVFEGITFTPTYDDAPSSMNNGQGNKKGNMAGDAMLINL
jgi:hypothetical protein